MKKAEAIRLLGGTVTSAAKEIGITYQAVDKWPDELTRAIEDRVIAALARRSMKPELLGLPAIPSKRARQTERKRAA